MFLSTILQDDLTKEVVQTAAHSTYSDSLVTIDTTTTFINNLQEVLAVNLYPNPIFGDHLYIELDEFLITELKLFDLLGNQLFTTSIQRYYDLNLEAYPAGMYILKLRNNTGQVNRKFIK